MNTAPEAAEMTLEEAVWVDADRVGGVPCFRGTRVPVQNLWDYVRGGHMVAEFRIDFPSVRPEHIDTVLLDAERAQAASLG